VTRAVALCTALLLATVLQVPGVAHAGERAAEDYVLNCSGCHRRDGSGTPGVVPSLRTLGPLLERPGAREYLARVPGVAQAPLDDTRLAALLDWVLRELSGVAGEPPYRADELAAWRRTPLRDPKAARRALDARR
jgi:mono/diheme cytochrome c family protein